jgi:hypothetical protein
MMNDEWSNAMSTEVLDAPVLADEKPDELIHQGNHFATRKLTFSEACLSWPALSGVQYEKLEKSILEAKGIRIPILCDREYRIIDGRHRYLIARKHGMPIPIMFLGDKDDPFLAAIDENMRNRLLKPDQLKATAARIAKSMNMPPVMRGKLGSERRKQGKKGQSEKERRQVARSRLAKIGEKFGVSVPSITRAITLANRDPSLFDAVCKGEAPMPAYRVRVCSVGRISIRVVTASFIRGKTFGLSDFDSVFAFVREQMLAASSVSIGAPSVAKKD